jgi:hypothetical protein
MLDCPAHPHQGFAIVFDRTNRDIRQPPIQFESNPSPPFPAMYAASPANASEHISAASAGFVRIGAQGTEQDE